MTTFHDVDRKQPFGCFAQELLLEPNKQYTDLELYLNDLMEYLYPQMDEMLPANGRGIIFWWSVQVKYNRALVRDADYDEVENLFPCHDDEDDEAMTMKRTAPSICTRGEYRSRIENSWQRGCTGATYPP